MLLFIVANLLLYARQLQGSLPASPSEEKPSDVALPKEIFVDMVAISDHVHRQLFSNENDYYQYVIALCNSVSLKFLTFRSPKINLLLTDVTWLSKDEDYHALDLNYDENGQRVFGTNSLFKLEQYLSKCEMYQSTGIILLLTGRSIFISSERGRVASKGVSDKGGICTKKNVAIVHDDGKTFKSVTEITRAFAHMLGADYDGMGSSRGCPASWRKIMGVTDPYHAEEFSSCTKDSIQKHLSTKPDCFKKEATRLTDSITLPGQLYSRSQICESLLVGHAFEKGNLYNCLDEANLQIGYCLLWCGYVQTRDRAIHGFVYNAPDGIDCGDKKMCVAGRCIANSEWEKVSQPSTVHIEHFKDPNVGVTFGEYEYQFLRICKKK